jgi:hypothetical protein
VLTGLDIALPAASFLYNGTAFTCYTLLNWKRSDALLWPLTAKQRGFTRAHRADPEVTDRLERELHVGPYADQEDVPLLFSSPPTPAERAEFERRLEKELAAPYKLRTYRPSVHEECSCPQCAQKVQEVDHLGWIRERITEEMERQHAKIRDLNLAYHTHPSEDLRQAIDEASERYHSLVERRDGI